MPIVETRQQDSLSGILHRHISLRSDGGATLSHHGSNEAGWRANRSVQPRLFTGDSSDCETASSSFSTATDTMPPLTRGNSVMSSDSDTQTDSASALQGGYVLEDDDGILTLPSSFAPIADLLCPFQILDCDQTLSSVRDFKSHVFSHFRGYPLPTFAPCFLCETRYPRENDDDDAELAWNKMLSHMAHDHYRGGQQWATIRADFSLMRWMYDRKIISDHCFKRTQIQPPPTVLPAASRRTSQVSSLPDAPSPPSPLSPTIPEQTISSWRAGGHSQAYVVSAGRRAERRRRDSTRPISRITTRTM